MAILHAAMKTINKEANIFVFFLKKNKNLFRSKNK